MITVATYVLGFLVVGVGLALLGAGVWSLVVGALVSSGSQTVWQYALLRHPIRPVLRREPYREVCGYGMRLTGAHLLDYVGANLDTYTVGRFADTAVVGQYSRAYYLAFQPLRFYLTQALTSVLFPHLSQIQHDATRLRRAYLSVLALGGIVVFPVCAGMAVAARELVLVVLGRQWSVAATAVPWFALAAGCSVMSALSQTVAEARADLYRSLGVQAAYITVLAAFLAGRTRPPIARDLGVRRGRRRRGGAPPRRLPGPHAPRRRAHHAPGVGVVRPGGLRERRRGARHHGRPQRARHRGAHPGDVRGRGGGRRDCALRCASGSARSRRSAASCACG